MINWFPNIVLCILVTLTACTTRLGTMDIPLVLTGPTMGTTYTITLTRVPADLDLHTLQRDIDQLLVGISNEMSTYLGDSELSLFNQNHSTEWVDVSPGLYDVIDASLRISRLTAGAFDVTVGRLVNLWGFGPSIPTVLVPSNNAIADAMRGVGYQHLHAQSSPPAVRKDVPALYVDLSAIAKGYAVDEVAAYLESLEIGNYLVEIGGELRSLGSSVRGTPWEVVIERPMPLVREAYRRIPLRNRAIATSGDYRNYIERHGQRFSHTINPNTGKPIVHRLASVTVISTSAMDADALATGLMVLGPERGYDVAVREDLAVLFLVKQKDGFREKMTPALARYLSRI